MNANRILFVLVLLIATASSAHANEFLFSVASAPFIYPLLLLWIAIGLIVRAFRKDVMFVGVPTFAFMVFFLAMGLLMGHPAEAPLMIWMIYLPFLTVYFARRRANVPESTRKANLAFHGTFLALVIIGGATGKAIYYSRMGSFATWTAKMQEFYPVFLLLWLLILTPIVGWFFWGALRRIRRQAAAQNVKHTTE